MEGTQYYSRLVELNMLAESIFCQNRQLILIDNNLNGVRTTKGGYRRNEIDNRVGKLGTYSNLFITLSRAQINEHLESVEKVLSERRDKLRERRKALIRELVKLNPSVTEMPLEEAKFLLR
ncbi:conserved Plasmodium protein, unknown function [Plasmodium vivax]|uniref:Uncharacterized protein n=6 Tax=Plasmodium vivax TaxID=5855 RepID=A5KC71_PLAVS|nr:hypothetical protein, conserved [Plasmodium vivax]KMZ82728.1 hypothetical protein PVIIG_02513 [Plasmodium vivax India VII]KMZ89121.1 hypothetical protein PVBG_03085 [Plasmodium vivax Brazil I]KMZ95338.1 hypothetical protein PVMG_05205 [Plasmodium vivax Mauritania I]KNA01833.1 hypothetical protein PVNG_02909 [Plasmodium vivax North Korean]EDL43089.1 hypothetical protein, conserved [Plasmodium vivax]|eukprot:XP_001612816.1 hypothetical protein [Plasmodium vivax Sal-1]